MKGAPSTDITGQEPGLSTRRVASESSQHGSVRGMTPADGRASSYPIPVKQSLLGLFFRREFPDAGVDLRQQTL
jgi:hypothetical protein